MRSKKFKKNKEFFFALKKYSLIEQVHEADYLNNFVLLRMH